MMETNPLSELPPIHATVNMHGFEGVKVYRSWSPSHVAKGQQAAQPTANQGPGIVRQAINYGKAKARHIIGGSRLATAEQIAERLAVCKACPSQLFYVFTDEDRAKKKFPSKLAEVPQVGTCRSMRCGCFIHDQLIEPNKLYWAEQECPKKHWGAIPPEPKEN